MRGEAWPGLIDAHLHLEGLADLKLTVDLGGAGDLAEALQRIKERAAGLPRDAWVIGAGWYNDAWPDSAFPTRRQLDGAVGGRPAYLRRKDGHSAWVSSAALALAHVDRMTADPPGGRIDRDSLGEPTGIVRETAMNLVADVIPKPSDADLDVALEKTLGDLARLGLTSVHS
ncbi:MAG TPA: amidohydrolase family protein, partial [Candidatus Udaeobacter sp.]|nr:amidohydrolase family protein [Candidatus Udaeobacter sp.]